MIIEWILSFVAVFFFPSFLLLCNPFFLPVSTSILKRKPLQACLSSYSTGIFRDLVLATPKFGMIGCSSLFSTLFALCISFYFSLDGFIGSCVLVTLLAIFDVLFTSLLGFIFCGNSFFSLSTLFSTAFLTLFWTFTVKSIPLILTFLSLRRRRE